MALGGGVFTNQNKILPGAYINFVSLLSSNASVGERGIAAIAVNSDWGPEGELFSLTKEEFMENASTYFGYDFSDEKLKGVRDIFLNVKKCFFYRLNSGTKAQNTYAQAKYAGVCGNKIKIFMRKNTYDNTKYDVITYYDGQEVDLQTVSTAGELVPNDFVTFKSFSLAVTANQMALSGGQNNDSGSEAAHIRFLSALESVSFNTLGCLSANAATQSAYIQFTKNMRDRHGIKFQTVLYNADNPQYVGIVNLKTAVSDENASGSELVYWVTGALAGCGIESSLTNKIYDGEFSPAADLSQESLAQGIQKGYFLFHRVGEDVRVLADINSFTEFTGNMGSDFANNQLIRIADTAASDLAYIFSSKYLGKVQNNRSGRISFWNEVVTYNRALEKMGVIEDFNSDEVIVEEGNTKDSVIVTNPVKIVSAMSKLYMTVVVA